MKTPKTKVCRKCGKRKKLEEYYRHCTKLNKKRSECKMCADAYHRHRHLDVDVRASWNAYIRRRYQIKNAEQIKKRKEQLRLAALRRAERKAEWELKQAYYQTTEFKEKRKLRKNAKDRRRYYSNPNILKKQNAIKRRSTKILSDGYVRKCIATNTLLSQLDIPQELVEIKREYIKLTRLLKEKVL